MQTKKVKPRRKSSLGFVAAKKLFSVGKRFATAKAVVHHSEEEANFKTSLGFTEVKTFAMEKLLFVTTKRKLIEKPFSGSSRRRENICFYLNFESK